MNTATWLMTLAFATTACTATIGGSDTDNDPPGTDAGEETVPDAAEEPELEVVVLSQGTGDLIADANVNCRYGELGPHADTSHFRVFPSEDVGGARITEAILPIEIATSPEGVQSATLRLHALTGAVLSGEFALITELDFDVEDQALGEVIVPLDQAIAEGTSLVVEVAMEDGQQLRNLRFGHNLQPQTSPTYYSSQACGQLLLVDLATLDNPFVPGATFAANSWLVSLRAEIAP